MSSLVTWSEDLAIGVPEIDGHHQGMIMLLNELHESVHRRRGVEACRAAVEKLRDYALSHFAVEMNLMRASGRDAWRENPAEQDELIAQLDDMLARMDDANSNITFHGLHQLKLWVLNHVRAAETVEESSDENAEWPFRSFRLALKRA